MAFTGLGAGVLGDPYQITTWAQFQEISTNLAAHFKLMNNIDAGGGYLTQNFGKFTGVFDGDNKELNNYGRLAGYNYLFIPSGATIKNLKLFGFKSLSDTPIFSNYATNADNRHIASASTFLNIQIISTARFSYTLDSCTLTNVYHFNKNLTEEEVPSTFYITSSSGTTFNQCFFYFIKRYTWEVGNSISFAGAGVSMNYYNDCSFIFDVNIRILTSSSSYGSIILFPNANFSKSWVGGKFTVDGSVRTSSFASDRFFTLMAGTVSGNFTMVDCHVDVDFLTNWGANQTKLWNYLISRTGSLTRVFSSSKLLGFTLISTDASTNTNNFCIDTNIITGVTPIRAGVTKLTAAQSVVNSNFTNFNFTTNWISAADGTPKLRAANYDFATVLTKVLESCVIEPNSPALHDVTANLYQPLPASATIKCYVSGSLVGLETPANLTNFTKVDDYKYIAHCPATESTNYYLVVYEFGAERQELSGSFIHYSVAQKETTIINVVNPNYRVFNTSTDLVYNIHGFIFHNGFLYGSARNLTTVNHKNIVKIKADDYSQVSYKCIFRDKNAENFGLSRLEQIIFCNGFLWVQAQYFNTHIVRIDPETLDYMVFNTPENGDMFQPIGTDGVNLFYTGNSNVYKLNAALLVGSFASYGYDGTAPVNLPALSLSGSCPVIQLHPTILCYSHSIAVDENYIYLAVTTSTLINGYDLALNQNICHLQKIDKNTMVTASDVVIPRCTDDMTQNDSFVFLAPELTTTTDTVFGASWGLLAVRKSNLELKYLKSLHSDFNTENESDRQTFGVQYYGGKIIVQLIQSLKSVVISLAEIETWGESFPIGGATEAIYNFQINGVNVTDPANELAIDNSGFAHITLWGAPSTIIKFSATEIGIIAYNAVSLHHNDTIALLEFLDTHYGCSIRCVQDAPGIATGTIGTATDQDGNIYDTVVINEKRWMVQNLKTTKFRNGDNIPNIVAAGAWAADETGGYCNVN